jgi:hypothetical protein
VVVTLTQRKEDKESGETFRIGATILFGLGDGKIRYVIHRRDRRGKMGEAIRDYREFRLASAQEVDPYNIAAHQGEPFAALHLIGRY